MERIFSEAEVRRDPTIARQELGPDGPGVLPIANFIGGKALEGIQLESDEPERMPWWNAGMSYLNKRGLMIVQNHDVYALKLDLGDQEPLTRIPHAAMAMRSITSFIQGLAPALPRLGLWTPDELSLHRYYDPDVGLSFHRDNERFDGVIAVLSVEGECEFKVRDDEQDQSPKTYDMLPGTLSLLRASRLFEELPDLLCPDHAVVNLKTPIRKSMQLRDNRRPGELVPGFTFANWHPDQAD
jgi:hypothetical protein